MKVEGEINTYLPVIRFNNDHWGLDRSEKLVSHKKIPAGTLEVTRLHWHKANSEHSLPYVRIRALAYRQLGTADTPRHFLLLDEVLVILGLLTKDLQKELRRRRGPLKKKQLDEVVVALLDKDQPVEAEQIDLLANHIVQPRNRSNRKES